ncbi:hypothetical protein L6164_001350 [Bauhinia variegata]|uniref:Uncharacterized protein n=1 Tax=Bauhinia variegata TaxID=167791 RepID=A0ACB9Q954_BAUVA|nr:hypothetical protein L6164_001350 [Bauhinia variegata]
MMVKCTPPTIIFLLCFLCNQSLCTTNSNVAACSAKDRQLLLHFKKTIVDPSHLLSSWSTEEDCCRWIGVQCHNTMGRVTKLNLTRSSIDPNYTAEPLTGEINLCVLELEFLNYLDLSDNIFTSIHYSEHDGQRNQNLSQVTTPHSSDLRHLDCSYNLYLQMDNLRWLSLVPSLKYLDLSFSNLSIVTNWLESITTMLPAVTELRLSFCELRHQIPSIQDANFTSLTVLDLSYNYYLQMDNLRWLSHFPSLKNLDLSDIDLSNVTDWFQSLATMLPSVTELRLSFCKLKHEIPSIQSANFTSLMVLDLSYNYYLQMDNLRWLSYFPFCDTINGSVYFLAYLDISHNLLSGELSDCWMKWQQLSYLNLGGNNLTGKIPHSMNSLSLLKGLCLQRNNFYGYVPVSLQNCKNLVLLDLGENNLSGSIPSWIGQVTTVIRLRANQFTGNIPSEICQISSLIMLDLAENRLFGPIPQCLHNISFISKESSFNPGLTAFSSYILYEYSVIVLNKRQEREYKENLQFMRLIDLSSNNLSRTILLELFGLS